MDMSKISVGENPPFDINVIIEVPSVSYTHLTLPTKA